MPHFFDIGGNRRFCFYQIRDAISASYNGRMVAAEMSADNRVRQIRMLARKIKNNLPRPGDIPFTAFRPNHSVRHIESRAHGILYRLQSEAARLVNHAGRAIRSVLTHASNIWPLFQ